MRALVFSLIIAASTPVLAQDALQLVLQAAPHSLVLAGSPENLSSLVDGLTQGKSVRLAGAGPAGFNRVLVFTPPARLSPPQAAALLERIAQDFNVLGIARPTPEQLAAALVGGVVDTPTGRTSVGAPRAAVKTELEPSEVREPTPEEQALAQLPAEIRSAVAGLPPKDALRVVELADQQLIALGTPYAATERRAQMVARLRYGGGYVDASAGQTSFPPLSPLVAPPLWQP